MKRQRVGSRERKLGEGSQVKEAAPRHILPGPCAGECGRTAPGDFRSMAYCHTCWYVRQVCEREGVPHLSVIANDRASRDALLCRISDLLRRTGVEDAELLIRDIERRTS